jgi:peptidoglycan/xylan/chitin deacetylase (PgdA/CDA1 family)
MISARALAETSLVWCGVDRWAARGRRGRTLVLAYHNIVADEMAPAGDRSLHLPRHRFAQQLDVLVELYDVIPLAAVLQDRPPGARPAVAITFDDAYQGALTLGAHELRARGLPATMFAAPGLLGGDSFWWDALAGDDDLLPAVRSRALDEMHGDGQEVRAWAVGSGRAVREMPAWGRPGAESDLAAWAADRSLTIGVHTWRHANLARLSTDDLEEELVKPLAWVRAHHSSAVLPWLTYPYGLATSSVVAAARAAGYEAALLASGGWMQRPVGDRYTLPRLNIPAGLTAYGFRLRLAGIIGRPLHPRHTLPEPRAGYAS